MLRLGTVYLLHFDRPYYHARHYVGWTRDLDERIRTHRSGKGSPLIRAVIEAGIGFKVARVWHNVTGRFERRIHTLRMTKRICPLCMGRDTMWPMRPRISDYRDPPSEDEGPPLQDDPSWPEPELDADPDYDFFMQDAPAVYDGPEFPPPADEPSWPEPAFKYADSDFSDQQFGGQISLTTHRNGDTAESPVT